MEVIWCFQMNVTSACYYAEHDCPIDGLHGVYEQDGVYSHWDTILGKWHSWTAEDHDWY